MVFVPERVTFGHMETLFNIALLLHFIGFAALFGGAFVQTKGPKRIINPAMLHGAITMLVTGLILTGVWEMGAFRTSDPNHMKIGIKLLVLIVIFALVLINRRKDNVPAGQFWGIAGLTALNAAIAVFW